MSEYKYTNKLMHEKSPYLLQHAHNPVDWFPWSDEAFEKAKSEDKPVFLSIGYSTCHWCHVMERESFEDEEVAQLLNKDFVSIKVDREERPDIDNIYMTVCQALTGHGGWPLTVFLTPDKKPFYAGTYFPKHDRMGMPGIMTLLKRVSSAWEKNRPDLIDSSNKITGIFEEYHSQGGEISEKAADYAYDVFRDSFDSIYGGFGSAPKFPSPHNLFFLLRYWYVKKEKFALEMVLKTLDSMYRGGIYDHIGFGFSRYSTDRKWLVPHFEKMLYDNALLAIAYLEAYQAAQKERYAAAAKQIFTYVLRDMTSAEGGFYSAEDADSEGVEGKFYLWTPEEIIKVLGKDDGEKYCEFFDISTLGNFEGKNIPNLIKGSIPEDDQDFFDMCRKKLFLHREKRIHPYKDDKILTSWNGLMAAAMAIGGRVLNNDIYTEAAENSIRFVFKKLVGDGGRLMARYRDGDAAHCGYIDDYAFITWALIELYQSTYKPYYLEKALKLCDSQIKLFWDSEHGGFFLYGSDAEQLITRPKDAYDGAIPSGNSVSALNFLRLARLTGRHELEEKAVEIFRTFGTNIQNAPRGHAFMLSALLYSLMPSEEVVVVSDKSNSSDEPMLSILNQSFRPFTMSLYYSDMYRDLAGIVPFVSGYKAIDGKVTAYICRNFSCKAPITQTGEFKEALSEV